MKKSIKNLLETHSRYRMLRKFNRLMKQMRTPLEPRSDGSHRVADASLVYTRVSAMINYMDIRTLFKNLLITEK